MIKCPKSVDKAVHEFIQLLIEEVEREQGIDITNYIDDALKDPAFAELYSKGPVRRCNKYITYQSKLYPAKRCAFTYKARHTNWATKTKHDIGDQCHRNARFEQNYCYRHGKSVHAKEAEKEEAMSIATFNEYYPNRDELSLLYGNIYVDANNIIVKKNSDELSKLKWVIICKSKVDPFSNDRIFFTLSKNYIEELNRKQIENSYNYVVDPSLFKQTKRDFSDYLMLNGYDSLDDIL